MSKLKIKTRGISMEVVGKDDLIQREREAFLFRTRCLQILSVSRRWPTRSGTSPRT